MGKNLTAKARLVCGIVGRGHHLPHQHQQRWERQQERQREKRERREQEQQQQQIIKEMTGKAEH